MTVVRYICAKCGKESTFKVNLNTYIITAIDLICDDHDTIERPGREMGGIR